jgi:tartrate-resistant acid phosphatase type 5
MNLISVFVLLFTLNASADFNILAVGDTGKGIPGQYEVGKALAEKCKQIDCKFSFLLGDNIYDVGISSPQDPQMIEKFELPYADMPVPFYVTLGNHDYGSLAKDWEKADFEIEYSKHNPNFILPSYYYTFEKEDTLFIVLDTSRLFHNKDTQQQVDFVHNALAKNTKKWVVVVGHHPYISNGTHGNAGRYDGVPFPPYSGSVIKSFIEKNLCGKIDIYLGGHDHNLQTLAATGVCADTLFVVSGTGASVTAKLSNKNKAHYQDSILGFTSLKFTKNVIEVSHHDVHGNTLHTYNYKKPSKFFNFSNWF